MKAKVVIDKTERRFVKPSSISTILKCSICMEVFYVPTRLFCGHTFCYDCLDSCLKSGPNCPMCRTEVNPKKSGKDILAYNIINELQVFCIYEECPWKGELELLESHVEYQCLLHSTSQSKRHKSKVEINLKPAVDDEVEERINQNINKGSLISRAINNDDSLKVGDRFNIARKMIQQGSGAHLEQVDKQKNNKKKTGKKNNEVEEDLPNKQQEKQEIASFLMDLFQ